MLEIFISHIETFFIFSLVLALLTFVLYGLFVEISKSSKTVRTASEGSLMFVGLLIGLTLGVGFFLGKTVLFSLIAFVVLAVGAFYGLRLLGAGLDAAFGRFFENNEDVEKPEDIQETEVKSA